MNRIAYVFSILMLCVSFCTFAKQVSFEPESVNNREVTWSYTVLYKDSFERIYQKYLNRRANIPALAKYNHLALSKKLQPGQVIVIPVEMLKKIPTMAQVLLVYGDVVVDASGKDKHKVNKGDLLAQGDTLETGKNSLAKLVFADGSNIDIQPNSSLTIQASFKYAGKETFVTRLKLVKGRTEVAANPEHVLGNTLQIETPSAIAAVRGTQFRVAADDRIALQETLEGQVAFSASGQEVLLAKGYGSIAEKDKAPLPPIALPDAPDVSALPKLIESKNVELSMIAQPAVVAWVVQLALDADFTQILNEQTSQSGKITFSDLADGQYFLKLRAQDEHGLQSRDATHAFSVKVKAPEPPPVPEPVMELFEPADRAVIPLAPTDFSWTAMSDANGYLVQIARDVNFENKIFEHQVSFNKLTIRQSFGKGEYYWRVLMLNDGKVGKYSEIRKFSR
jgi:hypothetical protein